MRLVSDITHEEHVFCFAALQTGVDGLWLGVAPLPGEEEFTRIHARVMKAFRSGDMSRVETQIRSGFPPHAYPFPIFRWTNGTGR